jgi:hypothetical protein
MSGKIERKSDRKYWLSKFNWMKSHPSDGVVRALTLLTVSSSVSPRTDWGTMVFRR